MAQAQTRPLTILAQVSTIEEMHTAHKYGSQVHWNVPAPHPPGTHTTNTEHTWHSPCVGSARLQGPCAVLLLHAVCRHDGHGCGRRDKLDKKTTPQGQVRDFLFLNLGLSDLWLGWAEFTQAASWKPQRRAPATVKQRASSHEVANHKPAHSRFKLIRIPGIHRVNQVIWGLGCPFAHFWDMFGIQEEGPGLSASRVGGGGSFAVRQL